MNELRTLNFEDHAIRMTEQNGETWWVAIDVGKALGLKGHGGQITDGLEDDEKGSVEVATLGGKQTVRIINESGLYALVIKGRKSEARRFRVWLTSKVIPTLRTTGEYRMESPRSFPVEKIETPIQMHLKAIQLLADIETQTLQNAQDTSALATRVGAIESRTKRAIEALTQVDPPVVPVRPLTARAGINKMINEYSYKTNIPHHDLYDRLYREFTKRYGVILQIRGKNLGISAMEYADKNGFIEDLYSLAYELFVTKPNEDSEEYPF